MADCWNGACNVVIVRAPSDRLLRGTGTESTIAWPKAKGEQLSASLYVSESPVSESHGTRPGKIGGLQLVNCETRFLEQGIDFAV